MGAGKAPEFAPAVQGAIYALEPTCGRKFGRLGASVRAVAAVNCEKVGPAVQ